MGGVVKAISALNIVSVFSGSQAHYQQPCLHQRRQQRLHSIGRAFGGREVGQGGTAAGVGDALTGLHQPHQDPAQIVALFLGVAVGQDRVGASAPAHPRPRRACGMTPRSAPAGHRAASTAPASVYSNSGSAPTRPSRLRDQLVDQTWLEAGAGKLGWAHDGVA